MGAYEYILKAIVAQGHCCSRPLLRGVLTWALHREPCSKASSFHFIALCAFLLACLFDCFVACGCACIIMPRPKQSTKFAQLSSQVAALQALLVQHGIQLPATFKQPAKKLKKSNSGVNSNVADQSNLQAEDSSLNSGWKTVTSSASVSKGPGQVGPSDTLQSDGWNVPVIKVCNADDVTASTCGIAIVSMAVGKRLVLNGIVTDGMMGLLLPAPCPGKGTEPSPMSVLVTDKHGKMQVRQRYLYQLGPQPVIMTCTAPKCNFIQDTSKAVLRISKKNVTKEVWESLQSRAIPATRAWLKNRVGVSVLDVHPPTRLLDQEDAVQIVVQVESGPGLLKLFCASGMDGVFVREFWDSASDRNRYKIVPLPFDMSLQQARDKATFLGAVCVGVMPCGKGFGVRVLTSDFESVLHKLRPDDASMFLGSKWEISGLPCSCGEESLLEFVSPWQVRPMFTFRVGQGMSSTRTWIVRAVEEPSATIVQHPFGLAVVKPFARTPQDRKPVQVMKPVAKSVNKSVPHVPLPKSWAAVVGSGGAKSALSQPRQAAPQPLKRPHPAADLPMQMEDTASPATAMGSASSTGTPTIQEQIAAALQPVLGLAAQVQCLQQEIAAMRCPGVMTDNSELPSRSAQRFGKFRESPY